MPRWSTNIFCSRTMSAIVITGNESAYGQPVSKLTDDGPVVPRQPPSTFEQITKYRLVSNALPGPIMLSHQPGLPVSGLMPAACASPENACISSSSPCTKAGARPAVVSRTPPPSSTANHRSTPGYAENGPAASTSATLTRTDQCRGSGQASRVRVQPPPLAQRSGLT